MRVLRFGSRAEFLRCCVLPVLAEGDRHGYEAPAGITERGYGESHPGEAPPSAAVSGHPPMAHARLPAGEDSDQLDDAVHGVA